MSLIKTSLLGPFVSLINISAMFGIKTITSETIESFQKKINGVD